MSHRFSFYFCAIYSLPEATPDVWGGIVDGALGFNKLLQDDTAAALPLLLSSVERIVSIHDFQFASSRAVNVADIYLKQGNLSEATVFFDSVIIATERDHERFNGQVLRFVEQKLHRAEQQLNERELHAAHFRIKTLFGICGLLLVALLIRIYYYRLLAKKNRAIVAQILEQNKMVQRRSVTHSVPAGQTSENQELFDRLNEYLYDSKDFLNETITRTELARALHTNEKYLQNAIRDCAEMTFAEYINSLRLQHACLLLGDRTNNDTIDIVATECGFANRITFYRLFMKKYGISPSEFRRTV